MDPEVAVELAHGRGGGVAQHDANSASCPCVGGVSQPFLVVLAEARSLVPGEYPIVGRVAVHEIIASGLHDAREVAYADGGVLKQALAPIAAARATAQLAVPFKPEAWIADRKARMDEGLNRLATAARQGTIPGGAIENGTLRLERLFVTIGALPVSSQIFDDAVAAYELGDFTTALRGFRSYADQGDVSAQLSLGFVPAALEPTAHVCRQPAGGLLAHQGDDGTSPPLPWPSFAPRFPACVSMSARSRPTQSPQDADERRREAVHGVAYFRSAI